MKKAKLIELKIKDIVIASGQEVYEQQNIREPIIPIYNTDMNAFDHAAVLSESVQLPIVRIAKCHQENPYDEPECEETYFILSQELRESLEVVRIEEEEKHRAEYLRVNSKLDGAVIKIGQLEGEFDQVANASLWKRIKYMLTGNANKLLD